MINKVVNPTFKPIVRLSPSHFTALKICSYKSILSEAFNRKALLPSSAQSYYGTVLHSMIELIYKGQIDSEITFERLFELEIEKKETELIELGQNNLIPLQINVKGFGLQKGLVKKIISQVNRGNSRKRVIDSEKKVESLNKIISGRIDLVVEDGNDIEIIDFKTGKITVESADDYGDNFLEVKREYRDQLKLYAYLFFETTGKLPTRLSIVDLAKQKYDIPFVFEESVSIYEEAKELLRIVNDSIQSQNFRASPTTENCRYCLFRPACKFHKNEIRTEPNDIFGEIDDVKKYSNGNVTVSINTHFGKVSIIKLASELFDPLYSRKKCQICVFNVQGRSNNIFLATKYTSFYEE